MSRRVSPDGTVIRLGRRMFLTGMSGALLAIPVLPSLLSEKEARAGTTNTKFFVHMRTPHGGIGVEDMWPTAASALTDTSTSLYAYPIRRGNLRAPVDSNGNAIISNVLSAPSSVLTPSIVAKMNILRGLDITTDLGHNHAGALAASTWTFRRHRGRARRSTRSWRTRRSFIPRSPACASDRSRWASTRGATGTTRREFSLLGSRRIRPGPFSARSGCMTPFWPTSRRHPRRLHDRQSWTKYWRATSGCETATSAFRQPTRRDSTSTSRTSQT